MISGNVGLLRQAGWCAASIFGRIFNKQFFEDHVTSCMRDTFCNVIINYDSKQNPCNLAPDPTVSPRSDHTQQLRAETSVLSLEVYSSETTKLFLSHWHEGQRRRDVKHQIRNDVSQDCWRWQAKFFRSRLINLALWGWMCRRGLECGPKLRRYQITTSSHNIASSKQEIWYIFFKAATHLPDFATHPVRVLPKNA